jgi:TnpA family transposase
MKGGFKFMEVDKKNIIKAISTSVKELQQGIDTHCCLVASILGEEVDERNLIPLLNLCPKRSREHSLEKAIREAIDVIEESRKAFKSKKLEALRKKLTAVLIGPE